MCFLLAPSVIFGFLALSYSPYHLSLLGISQDQVSVICKVGLVHYLCPLLSPWTSVKLWNWAIWVRSLFLGTNPSGFCVFVLYAVPAATDPCPFRQLGLLLLWLYREEMTQHNGRKQRNGLFSISKSWAPELAEDLAGWELSKQRLCSSPRGQGRLTDQWLVVERYQRIGVIKKQPRTPPISRQSPSRSR